MRKTNGYKADWYRHWFGPEYLKVYRHRDHADAATLIQLFLQTVRPAAGRHFLDIGCGNGRHARLLAEHGLRVTGIDLSMPLLIQAQKNKKPNTLLIRADMRALPLKAVFDGALSLFTSFGYFFDDEDNERVLRQVFAVLKPGGSYFIDYLNPAYVKEHLIAESFRATDDMQILEKRWLDDQRVYKEIVLIQNDQRKVFQESVRLYSFDELAKLLQQNGFAIEKVFGNYRGKTYDASAERMIILCSKSSLSADRR